MTKKILLSVFACLTPLFFPWPLVLLVTLIAAWYFPWIALVVGTIEDFLYAPSIAFHHGLYIGLTVAVLMYGVRYVVKTRIMQS